MLNQLKLSVLSIFIFANGYSQNDSLKKFRFSGVLVDVGIMATTEYGTLNADDYKTVAPNDILLNNSFVAYNRNFYFGEPQGYPQFPAYGLKAFFDLKKKGKINKEVFLGIRYRNSILSALNFQKEIIDTVGYFTSQQTATQFYQIKNTYSNYSFAIVAKQLFIPFGFNITTHKVRLVWLTAGLEFAPGVTFNQQYRSLHWQDTQSAIVEIGSNQSYSNFDQKIIAKNVQPLTNPGFCAYAALPLSLNIRLSKNIKILKNCNLTASIMPGFSYTYSKYVNSTFGPMVSSNIGLRINW